MAKKGARPGKSTSKPAAAALPKAQALPAVIRPNLHEESHRAVYLLLDWMFTIGYFVAFELLVNNRLGWARTLMYLLPFSSLLMFIGTLVGRRLGWWAMVVGGVGMLVWMVGIIAVLLWTASYLSGVYGAFGKAASMSTVLSTAFVLQFAGMLPFLQLKWGMTRAGRRAFWLPPLWATPPLVGK